MPLFAGFFLNLIRIRGELILNRYLDEIESQGLAKFQERILLEKITRNCNSDFGRENGFEEIKTVADFQARLPLSDYEYFSSYIARVKSGEVTALFHPKEKIHMFALTSGTTGDAKYIPVPTPFLKEYEEGSKIWGASVVRDFPGSSFQKILILFSPLEEERSEKGVPCGAISGLISRNQGKLVKPLYGAPFEASELQDPTERQYAFLRAASEHSIGLISTANPSTLLAFAHLIERRGEQLVYDLEMGLLNGASPPFSLRKMPKRAAELKQVLKEKGILTPRDLWPDLKMLACWKGGTLFHYLDKLPEHYGDLRIRDLGLLASEGRFSLPLFSDKDDGLLNVFHHFFEFISEDEEDTDNPQVLLAHQLKQGKRYLLVVTTSSGLYRYHLNDLIEVTEFYRGIPLIRFLNKGKHIASLTGEKITEHQVLSGFQKAVINSSSKTPYFRFFPTYSKTPHYKLYIEEESVAVRNAESFLQAIDQSLCEQNIEYASKRHSGRLTLPELHWVRFGTFSSESQNSHRPEQFKPIYLDPDPDAYLKYESALI